MKSWSQAHIIVNLPTKSESVYHMYCTIELLFKTTCQTQPHLHTTTMTFADVLQYSHGRD